MGFILGLGDWGLTDIYNNSVSLYNMLLDLCNDQLDWENVQNKPELYTKDETYNRTEIDALIADSTGESPPFEISDVTGLQAELDDRYTESETDALLDGKSDVGHTHPTSDIIGLDAAIAAMGVQIVESLPGTVTNGKVYIVHPSGADKFKAYISSGGVYVALDAVTYSALSTALASKQNILTGNDTQYVKGDGTYGAFTKAAIGLGNVPNLAAADLPVSDATAIALSAKANTSDVLLKTGNQTKTSGILTFNVSPKVPTPTDSDDAVPLGYVTSYVDALLDGDVEIGGDLSVLGQIKSLITGLAPFVVASSLLVSNLNAEFLNGHPSSDFALASHTHATLTRGNGLSGSNYDGSAATSWAVVYGTGSNTAVEGTHVGSGGSAHANATTSVSGFLSAADKTSYDGAVSALSGGSTSQYFRGDKTWQTLNTSVVPESGNLYFTTARVLATVLTGYTAGSNTPITAAHTALNAFRDLQAQISSLATSSHAALTLGTANGLSLSTQVLSLQLAGSSATGALSSSDWNTFNGKQASLSSGSGLVKSVFGTISYITDNSANWNTAYGWGDPSVTYTPLARTITIDGTAGNITSSAGAQSFAANRAWTINLATAGTAGTYKSVTTDNYGRVTSGANPTTVSGYGITDILAQLLTGFSATNSAIVATDTILQGFNKAQGQISALSTSSHAALTLGTANGLSLSTQVLSLQLATSSVPGALSAADWTTFNGKQAAITATTSADYYRGDKTFVTLNTAAVPESGNLYFTTARVLATALTGYTTGSNTALTSSNTILTAFQNVQAQISALGASSHAALTLGTSNGLSLSTQVLSLQAATTSLTGALTSTDWNTFNGKQAALNGTGYVRMAGTTVNYDSRATINYWSISGSDVYTIGNVGVGGVPTVPLHIFYPNAKTYTGTTQVIRFNSNDSNPNTLEIAAIGGASQGNRAFTFQTSETSVAYGGIIQFQGNGGVVQFGSGGVDMQGAFRFLGSAGSSGQYLKSAGGSTNTWGAITSGDVTTALGYTPISSLTDTLQTVMARGASSTIKATFKTGTASGGFEFLRMEPTDYGTGKGALGFVSNGSHNFSISVFDGSTYGTVEVIGTLKAGGYTVVNESRTLTIFGNTQSLAANRTWTMAGSDVNTALGYTPVTNARTLTIFGSTLDLSSNRTWTMASGDVTTALGYTPVTNARTLTINGTGYDLSANRSWTISGTSDTWQDVLARGAVATTKPVIKAGTASGGYDFLRLEPTDYGTGKHAFNFTADSPGQWNISSFDGSTYGILNIIGTLQYNGSPIMTPSSTNTFTNKSGNISMWFNDSGYVTASSTNTFTNKSGNISQWTNNSNYIASATVNTQYSLTGGGSAGNTTITLNLVNDTSSPGNNMLYGTNGSGTRGWYAQPSGGGITGSGSVAQLAVFTSSGAIGDSYISQANMFGYLKVNVGNSSTRVDIITDKGLVQVGSFTASQVASLASVSQGMILYQSDGTSGFYGYKGGGTWTFLG